MNSFTDTADFNLIEDARQSLVESEKRFRFISENLSDFISIHDTEWNYTYASPSIKNVLGFEPADVLNKTGFDFICPGDLLRIINNSLRPVVIEKKEAKYRYRMLSKNGEYKWVETYSKPVVDCNKEISSIISSTRDVTEQVHAENKLKESEEQYRLLSENSNDVICILSTTEQFIYVSPSCKQVFGFEPTEMLGRKPKDVFSLTPEKGRALQAEIDKILTLKEEHKFISKITTGYGTDRLIEVWMKPVVKGEEVIGIQSSSRDVTEREKLLKDLEQSLAKERELNDLRSKFVSTASHQFRTPLTVIQSGVEIMDMYLDDLPADIKKKFQKQFGRIQEEVSRLEHLMSDILLLGRANAVRTPFHPVVEDLVRFCSAIIMDKYNNRYPADRQVVLQVKGEETPVSFDPKLLGHAIENIISNAYKYSEAEAVLLELEFKNDCVQINITDRGIGIPEEDIKNLFQPFHRAKNASDIEGTGLGLSIVKEFVEKHNGEIFLASKLNKGTTVSVILPVEQK